MQTSFAVRQLGTEQRPRVVRLDRKAGTSAGRLEELKGSERRYLPPATARLPTTSTLPRLPSHNYTLIGLGRPGTCEAALLQLIMTCRKLNASQRFLRSFSTLGCAVYRASHRCRFTMSESMTAVPTPHRKIWLGVHGIMLGNRD